MKDFHLTSLVCKTKGISMTTVYRILSETEGSGPGPLVQNMVNIGPRPGAPRSQRVNNLIFQISDKWTLYADTVTY